MFMNKALYKINFYYLLLLNLFFSIFLGAAPNPLMRPKSLDYENVLDANANRYSSVNDEVDQGPIPTRPIRPQAGGGHHQTGGGRRVRGRIQGEIINLYLL